MATAHSTVRIKKNLTVISARYLSLALSAVLCAIALPVLLATILKPADVSFVYSQSDADFYGLVITLVLTAALTYRLKIDSRTRKLKPAKNLSFILALILGLLTVVALWIGITSIIGVVPTVIEPAIGKVVSGMIQVGILGLATKYFWNEASK